MVVQVPMGRWGYQEERAELITLLQQLPPCSKMHESREKKENMKWWLNWIICSVEYAVAFSGVLAGENNGERQLKTIAIQEIGRLDFYSCIAIYADIWACSLCINFSFFPFYVFHPDVNSIAGIPRDGAHRASRSVYEAVAVGPL